MDKNKLLHGQALSMQWVVFALQKIIADVESGGGITNQLLDYAKTADGKDGLKPLALGCTYVANFILPFTIELALKSLILKEGKNPNNIHDLIDLYNELSDSIKLELHIDYLNQLKDGGNFITESLRELFERNRKDFANWRYLDNPTSLSSDTIKMQIAISSLLKICNL